jgi:hypothetical protein
LIAGFQCLTGTTPACASTDCSKAPVVALAYVACNLGLNISALALLRKAGAGICDAHEGMSQAEHAWRPDPAFLSKLLA